MGERGLQWHPGFQAALQIELAEDQDHLMIGYACLYQSDTARVLEISPKEITITLVSNRFPRSLIRHLKETYHVQIMQEYPGIYYVSGLMFPIQILVNHLLSADENVWLSRLRQDLTMEADVEVLLMAYRERQYDPLYEATMDLIIRANEGRYKESEKMCEALRELFADELEQRWNGGKAEGKSEGKAESVLELLNELGAIPERLRIAILEQQDLSVLTRWLKSAAKAQTIEEFQKDM